jgi:hypothetical protein
MFTWLRNLLTTGQSNLAPDARRLHDLGPVQECYGMFFQFHGACSAAVAGNCNLLEPMAFQECRKCGKRFGVNGWSFHDPTPDECPSIVPEAYMRGNHDPRQEEPEGLTCEKSSP